MCVCVCVCVCTLKNICNLGYVTAERLTSKRRRLASRLSKKARRDPIALILPFALIK